MSLENILRFRDLANSDDSLASRYVSAIEQGPPVLVALAKESGFDCTESEMSAVIEQISASGDLTDLELELVSGGGDTGCQNGLLTGQRKYGGG